MPLSFLVFLVLLSNCRLSLISNSRVAIFQGVVACRVYAFGHGRANHGVHHKEDKLAFKVSVK